MRVPAARQTSEPLAVEQVCRGRVGRDSRAAESLDRFGVQVIGAPVVGQQRVRASGDPESPIGSARLAPIRQTPIGLDGELGRVRLSRSARAAPSSRGPAPSPRPITSVRAASMKRLASPSGHAWPPTPLRGRGPLPTQRRRALSRGWARVPTSTNPGPAGSARPDCRSAPHAVSGGSSRTATSRRLGSANRSDHFG